MDIGYSCRRQTTYRGKLLVFVDVVYIGIKFKYPKKAYL